MFFEGYKPGDTFDLGQYAMEAGEMVEFAKKFDPQVFHTDPIAAQKTVFGGLVASGFHTASIMMKLMVENYLDPSTALGSPGLRSIEWKAPVRPGDVLVGKLTIEAVRTSSSKPDRGYVEQKVQLYNQNEQLVLQCYGTGIFRRRKAP